MWMEADHNRSAISLSNKFQTLQQTRQALGIVNILGAMQCDQEILSGLEVKPV